MKNDFKIDIESLYRDNRIPFVSGGHKHSTTGWTNTHCPFCEGKEDYHLGYNNSDGYFVCWRCGFHGFIETISELLHIPERSVFKFVRKYRMKYYDEQENTIEKPQAEISLPHILPSGCGPLQQRHIKYLRKRGLDHLEIEQEYRVKGAGPVSRLDNISFSNRIIIPIFWDGVEVSFQARDISGESDLRYIACPKSREVINHKKIIYKHPDYTNNDIAIITEGVFDAWKIGKLAISTFGVKFTPYQVSLISKMYKRVAILYDNDEAGISQAEKLSSELSFAGREVRVLHVRTDPGDMEVCEARAFAAEAARWNS